MKFILLAIFSFGVLANAGPFEDLSLEYDSLHTPKDIQTLNSTYFGECFEPNNPTPFQIAFIGIVDSNFKGFGNLKFTIEAVDKTPQLGKDVAKFREYYRDMFDNGCYAQGEATLYEDSDELLIDEISSDNSKVFLVRQNQKRLVLKLRGYSTGTVYWMCQFPTN